MLVVFEQVNFALNDWVEQIEMTLCRFIWWGPAFSWGHCNNN